jgi:MscS family membrane protein
MGLKKIIRVHLAFSGQTYEVVDFILGLILLFAVIGVIWGVGSRSAAVLTSSRRFSVRGMDAQLIRLICRIVSIVAVIVVFLEGGKRLGIPLSTLVAGAGISGFAVAMAAQDSLKNILGSMMIALDKPYTLDERIQIGGFDGVVEDIGLRSTKIRLLNGHQAIIPNDEMARTQIENIGRRPFIRRLTDIPLPIDMPSAKANRAVEIVGEILKDHEGMDEAFPPRIWLNEFRRDHLELKMIYWYHPPNYWDFTAHADRINRQILDAFEAEGIRMAVPTFTTRLEDENARPVVPPTA